MSQGFTGDGSPPLPVSVGNGGTGATTADAARAALLVMSKNKLINGVPLVWQRGTTFVPTTAGMYTADRWLVTPAGASLTEAGQETTILPANLLSLYALRLRGAASVTTVDVAQRIEAKNAAPLRQNCTFSFWLYGNTGAAFKPKVRINTADVADVFAAVTNKYSQDQADNTEDGWKKYTVTFDATAYANAEKGIEVVIRIPSGSLDANTKYVYLSQMQLEVGTAATEFEIKPIQQTINECLRYHIRWQALGAGSMCMIAMGYRDNPPTNGCFVLNFPVPMRYQTNSYNYSAAGDLYAGGAVFDGVTSALDSKDYSASGWKSCRFYFSHASTGAASDSISFMVYNAGYAAWFSIDSEL